MQKALFKEFSFYFSRLILAGIFLGGCSTSRHAEPSSMESRSQKGSLMVEVKESEYKVQPGDHVKISVWDNDKFNTDMDVTHQGTITIPLAGDIKVSGLTKKQISSKVKQILSHYIKGQINLTITILRQKQEYVVSVLGSVARPDNYSVQDTTSIFKILSMAGGSTADADLRNIRVYHRGDNPHMEKLDLSTYLKNGRVDTLSKIDPGDIVYVPKQNNVVEELSGFMRDVVVLFGIFRVFN